MAIKQIAFFVGSLRKESFNRILENVITSLAPGGITFKQVEFADLPPYNQDDEERPPESVRRLKQDI